MINTYVTPEGSVSSFDSFDPDPTAPIAPEASIDIDEFDPDQIYYTPEACAVALENLLKQQIDMLEAQLREKDQEIDAKKLRIEMLESQLRAAV